MSDNTVPRNGSLPAHKGTDSAPRLYIVRNTPRILCRRDGEAKLERVQAYLLRQLRAAKRLGLPAYVRYYGIAFHSLLIDRVMRQKGL